MQQANTAAVKNYKFWVMKAHKAAKAAQQSGTVKEMYPQYVAANNMAKGIFTQLQKFTAVLIIVLSLNFACKAQSIVKDAAGNYTAVKTTAGSTGADQQTGKTYKHSDGKNYPLFLSKRGKLYCIVTSKNGNQYKKYMPTEK